MKKNKIICKPNDDTEFPFVCKCYTCREETLSRKPNIQNHKCNPLCKWVKEGDTHLRCKLCGQMLPIEEVTQKEECPTIVGMRGLGDVIAVAAKKIGIKQHKDCGCGSKQSKLNNLVPFKKG